MTRSIVMDVSLLGEYVLDAPASPEVGRLLLDEACEVLVPHLCDIEIASLLRSVIARKQVSPARAEEAIDLYAELPLERVEHVPLLPRILALRDNFAAYDAAYVAVAELMGATFHTSDRRLAHAVREHTTVEVVEV